MVKVRIGTSGWHYKHWLGPFYPQGLAPSEMLKWYVEHFDTVEINNSFYRLPSASTFESWRRGTPTGFCFAVKASRYLTHRKKLREPDEALQSFLIPARKLGPKLGPLLFQLPPRWHVNTTRLEEFLRALPRRQRSVIEFRDPSWHISSVYELLRRHNVAFCIYDLAGATSPIELTASFGYVRLHGPGSAYHGSYPSVALEKWAKQIERWQGNLEQIFVYFNNDVEGHAVRNALSLLKLIRH